MPTGKIARARHTGTDQSDRIPVVIGQYDHLSLKWTMFLTGHAHHYNHGDTAENVRLREAQNVAKSAKQGLWHRDGPITPNDWRQRNQP